MLNNIGCLTINLIIVILLISLKKPVQGTYYGFAQDPSDLEDILEGYETGLLPKKSLQEDGNVRNDQYPDWEPEYPTIKEDIKWPGNELLNGIGQVAGIAAHKNNTLYIFQRGDHVWDYRSMDMADQGKPSIENSPIDNDTVLVIDTKTGKLIKSWGSKRFYMPHGISVDREGNIWLTDVALHQVFRFKKDDLDNPDLVLGQPFQPGRDWHHFCMPTDVAIASTGMVYISDGYCNSRILILSPSGMVLDEIGTKDNIVIPHSLVLLEEENLICVADRENRRILCYSAGLDGSRPGLLMFNVDHPRLARIFAIDRIGDVLFALSVPDDASSSEGVTLDLATERIINVWKPSTGFGQPHDLSISPDRRSLYVTDIAQKGPKKVYKFDM